MKFKDMKTGDLFEWVGDRWEALDFERAQRRRDGYIRKFVPDDEVGEPDGYTNAGLVAAARRRRREETVDEAMGVARETFLDLEESGDNRAYRNSVETLPLPVLINIVFEKSRKLVEWGGG